MMVNWLSFYYASMGQTEPTVTRAPQEVDGQKKNCHWIPILRLTKMVSSVRSPRSCFSGPLHPSTHKNLFKKNKLNPSWQVFWFQHLSGLKHTAMYRFDTVCMGSKPRSPSSWHSRVAEVDSTSVTKVLLERGMDRSHKSSQCILPELITKKPTKRIACGDWMMAALLTLPTASSLSLLSLSLCLSNLLTLQKESNQKILL
jgi:hypothetical protein